MSWLDDEKRSAEAFERALLDSARDDGPALDAQQAWAKFASAMSQVAAGAEPGSGLHPAQATRRTATADASTSHAADGVHAVDSTAPALRGGASTRLMPVRARYGLIVRWLLLGAIGGSALTAAWFAEHPRTTPRATSAPAVNSTLPTQTVRSDELAARATPTRESAILHTDEPPAKPQATSPAARHESAHRSAREQRASAASARSTASVRSTAPALRGGASMLAAEIARLDAIRRAYQAGEYARAITGVDEYHRDFPHGALAPDAEVLAIEALAEAHDARASDRASAFLLRYPADPHAARVSSLADR